MANWLTVNPTSGTAGENVAVTLTPVSENTGREQRKATLHINVGGETIKSVSVAQAGRDPFVDITTEADHIAATGGTVLLNMSANTHSLSFSTDNGSLCAIGTGVGLSGRINFFDTSEGVFIKASSGDTQGLMKLFHAVNVATDSQLGTEIAQSKLLSGATYNREVFVFGSPQQMYDNLNSDASETPEFYYDIDVTFYGTYDWSEGQPEDTSSNISYSFIMLSSDKGMYQAYSFDYIPLFIPKNNGKNTITIYATGYYGAGESETSTLTITYDIPTVTVSQNASPVNGNIEISTDESQTIDIESNNDWTIDASDQTQL